MSATRSTGPSIPTGRRTKVKWHGHEHEPPMSVKYRLHQALDASKGCRTLGEFEPALEEGCAPLVGKSKREQTVKQAAPICRLATWWPG